MSVAMRESENERKLNVIDEMIDVGGFEIYCSTSAALLSEIIVCSANFTSSHESIIRSTLHCLVTRPALWLLICWINSISAMIGETEASH